MKVYSHSSRNYGVQAVFAAEGLGALQNNAQRDDMLDLCQHAVFASVTFSIKSLVCLVQSCRHQADDANLDESTEHIALLG